MDASQSHQIPTCIHHLPPLVTPGFLSAQASVGCYLMLFPVCCSNYCSSVTGSLDGCCCISWPREYSWGMKEGTGLLRTISESMALRIMLYGSPLPSHRMTLERPCHLAGKKSLGRMRKKDGAKSICQKKGYKPAPLLVRLSCPIEHGEAQYNCEVPSHKYFPPSSDSHVCEQSRPVKELAAIK